ncbi:hypothetical protein KAU11_09095, partial [Candidatus Babeliales bacterium]|nr:hypothetical protein [Candidatus Babeliales bacterium]
MIDKTKIPPLTREIIDNYMLPSMPRADYDYLVLLVTYGVSKMLCHNRVILRSEVLKSKDTAPNFYMISFSPSGSGKDKGMRFLKCIMERVYTEIRGDYVAIHEYMKKTLDKKIELKGLKKDAANAYRAQHSPRHMKSEIDSSATPEGFVATREAFFDAKTGCTCWEDSEIYDTFQSKSSTIQDFQKLNKEAFDQGETKGKVIKGNKKPVDIDGVPHLIALHGSIDDTADIDIFKPFFDQGYARRCFVFMSSKEETYVPISVDKRIELSMRASSFEGQGRTLFSEIFNHYKRDISIRSEHGDNGRKILKFTKEAERRHMEYVNECEEEGFKYSGSNNKGVGIAIEHNWWKVLKLSGVICAQERGDIITKEHIETAIYMANYYTNYFKKFYLLEKESNERIVADLIMANPGIMKSDIKKSKALSA